MTKENKGLLTAILIMPPTLWFVADVISKATESDGLLLSSIIAIFLVVNFLFACLCSEKRTTKNIFFLFIIYTFVTLFSTIVIAITAFFIGLKTGAIKLGKIGG
jgi:glucan phosphoethanolaminetransferase (alkaline phosphatase superfamily)